MLVATPQRHKIEGAWVVLEPYILYRNNINERKRELPLPEELKSIIEEYASDRVGVHQTAQLIQTLKMFELMQSSCFKMVMCVFKSGDYFVVLRDGGTCRDVVRTYDLFYHKKGGVYRP